ncbi:MAG: structural maintenance of chromosomes 6 [Trebouxia sp. A1-2]|nr:MAG: structural maintenance of chromosomes 6 [Trebouxia sp. A1-2]
MRAMGPVYMSRRQKASLSEPQSLQAARETFTAAKVQKLFPANDQFAGGTFTGVVEGVDGKIAQEDGTVLRGIWYRIKYEDGDNEHILWEELRDILTSLPGKDEAEEAITPAVVTKPKRTAGKTGKDPDSSTEDKSMKKQKLSPAEQPTAETPQEGHAQGSRSVPTFPDTAKGTRSKRQRTLKSYAAANQDNDENDCQVANTPLVQPSLVKKLRIVGPTPHASQTAVKSGVGKSTAKRDLGKSTIKKELERFTLEDRLSDDGSPGQLHKVKLVNFICHEHFEMDFCPHINFVSGTNGSGKSAVLQAIQQVLGVRASATNRASTQKEFIRKGAHEALISVTLWNKGEDAYQPEKWGSFITIDRRIGNSCSWSIKDAKGRKREENRASLDGILDALNLNGSNPIAVMTQDITRSFLAGSNEKSDRKKFDIYMEATLMAQSQENYQVAQADLQKIADSVNQAQAVYKQLKARREELGRADEETQMMSGMAWATVGEMEPRLHQLEQSIEHGLPGKLMKIEACLGPAKQKVEDLQKQYEGQLATMANFNQDFQHIGEEVKKLKEVHAAAKAVTKKEQQNVVGIKEHIAELTMIKEETLSSVRETQQGQDCLETQAAADQLQSQLAQSLQSCEEAVADELAKDEAYRQASVSLSILLMASQEVRAAVDHLEQVCKPAVQQLQTQVTDITQEIENLRRSTENRLCSFGQQAAVTMANAIKKHRKQFHRMPVGPVGFHMSLTDASEKNCGHIIMNHIVDSVRHISIVHTVTIYDTKQPTYQDAAKQAAQHPQVKSAFIRDGSKYMQRGQTMTFYSGKPYGHARLGGDSRADMVHLQSQLAEKQVELEAANAQFKSAEATFQACFRAHKAAKQERSSAIQCKNEAQSQWSELLTQSQADLSVGQADEGDTDRELRELAQQLVEAQQEVMTAQAECDRAVRTEQEAFEAWESKRSEGSKLQDDNDCINNEIQAQELAVQDAKAQLHYYECHQHDTNQKLEALKSSLEESQKLLASNTQKAEQALTQALGKLRAKMTHQEKENGGKGEDILLKHAEVQSQCKEHKDRLQRLQNTYYLLRTACDKRIFNFYMYKKGHTGMIKVKRATEKTAGTLEIKVRIGGNEAKTGNVKDLKQLSGGEKSYTTVAFALALGEWTQSPFRAMDEFDVFMDAINRRVAMENLFSNSLEHPDLQFILLTPQDINAVEEAKKNLAARGTPLPEDYCKVVLMRSARE